MSELVVLRGRKDVEFYNNILRKDYVENLYGTKDTRSIIAKKGLIR